MGRIRTIKPEFPQSQKIGRVSREARLLFILLWTQADDSGRLRGSSRMLASLLYPYDDDAPSLILTWLGELEKQGSIRRYSVDRDDYIDIPKWLEHQKIDRPSASKFPSFDECSRDFDECSRSFDLARASSWIKDQVSKEGDREENCGAEAPSSPANGKPVNGHSRGTRLDPDFDLMPDEWHFCHDLGLDPNDVLPKFKDYWIAVPGAKGVKLDWLATWRSWCRKEADYQRERRK